MSAGDWQIIGLTAWTAGLAVLLNLAPAVALAWALARKSWWGKSVVETLVALPLVLPPVATGLILLKLFGRRGPLGSWLEAAGIEIAFTWREVVVAMAVMAFPLMVRGMRIAFEGVNPRLEQVAATLGAGPLRVFFTVTLPLAYRGVLAGVVLGFARAIGEFGATILLAGNIPGKTATLSLSIYHDIQLGRDHEAMPLLLAAVLLAFAALWASERLLRRP